MSTTSTWTVTGMTCGHCVASVTEELQEVAGVLEVRVDDLVKGGVTSAEPLSREAVEAAVGEAGYQLA